MLDWPFGAVTDNAGTPAVGDAVALEASSAQRKVKDVPHAREFYLECSTFHVDQLVRYSLSLPQRSQIRETALGPVNERLNVRAKPVQFVGLGG